MPVKAGIHAAHLVTLLVPALLAAQPAPPLGKAVDAGPIVETWHFSSALYQFAGADSVQVRSVTQLSVPWRASTTFGTRWTVDADGAYASGTVRLGATDPRVGTRDYQLSGLTDTRLRAVGRVVGDRVLVSLGATIPTGSTGLGARELSALRVLAAPALALSAPAAGSGAGGTAGLIVAQQVSRWALAFGGTYEKRGTFSPIAAITAGADAPEYRAGDAVHLSAAADGIVGSSGMTLALTADFYGEDALTLRPTNDAPTRVAVRLGPTLGADWVLRLASPIAQEVTLYASERYRAPFTRGGVTVNGSNGHQLEAGMHSVLPVAEHVGFVADAEARYHTGLRSDNTLATAAVFSTGTTLGVRIRGGSGFSATPFARLRYGVFGSDERTATGTYVGGGLTFSMRF